MKPIAPALSLITLTKNRAAFLKLHLASLVGQTKPGDEIIIIDNRSTDETGAVITSYRHILPIRSFTSKACGFSRLYNLAIRKTKNRIIVFFDDDCVAETKFLDGHRNAHRDGMQKIVQGQTLSLPKGNIYAEMMGDHYQNWLRLHMNPDGTLQTFDNKNVSLPKALLTTYGMFSLRMSAGAEDIELGMRLRRHGIPIVFDRSIVASHYERTTLRTTIIQHLRFARTDAILARYAPQEPTLRMLHGTKIRLHASRATKRALHYLQTGRITDALLTPWIYLILFITRVWGYATAR